MLLLCGARIESNEGWEGGRIEGEVEEREIEGERAER